MVKFSKDVVQHFEPNIESVQAANVEHDDKQTHDKEAMDTGSQYGDNDVNVSSMTSSVQPIGITTMIGYNLARTLKVQELGVAEVRELNEDEQLDSATGS